MDTPAPVCVSCVCGERKEARSEFPDAGGTGGGVLWACPGGCDEVFTARVLSRCTIRAETSSHMRPEMAEICAHTMHGAVHNVYIQLREKRKDPQTCTRIRYPSARGPSPPTPHIGPDRPSTVSPRPAPIRHRMVPLRRSPSTGPLACMPSTAATFIHRLILSPEVFSAPLTIARSSAVYEIQCCLYETISESVSRHSSMSLTIASLSIWTPMKTSSCRWSPCSPSSPSVSSPPPCRPLATRRAARSATTSRTKTRSKCACPRALIEHLRVRGWRTM